MSDELQPMFDRWRSGTDALAPRPEFVSQLQAQVTAQSVQPPRVLEELPRPVPSAAGWTKAAWVFGLLLTVGVGFLVHHLWSTPTTVAAPVAPAAAVRVPCIPVAPVRVQAPPVAPPSPSETHYAGAGPSTNRPPLQPCIEGAPLVDSAPAVLPAAAPAKPAAPAPAAVPSPRDVAPRSPVVPVQLPPDASTERMPAYPFDATTLDGRHYALTELRGKVVMLDFWEDECGLCWSGVADLEQLQRNFPEVVFLSFSVNTAEHLRSLGPRRQYPLPVVADPDALVAGNYGVHGYPSFAVIDRFGRRVPVEFDFHERYKKVREAIILALDQVEPAPRRATDWFEGPCKLDGVATAGPHDDLPVRGGMARLNDETGERRLVQIAADGHFAIDALPCRPLILWGTANDMQWAQRLAIKLSRNAVTHVRLHFDPEAAPLEPPDPSVLPAAPVKPETPTSSAESVTREAPTAPVTPVTPVKPVKPVKPVAPDSAAPPSPNGPPRHPLHPRRP